jgi:xanthine dehydrogenase YagR molybdenum-binding subunit
MDTFNAAAPEPRANMGAPLPRVDGRAKVTGAARYPSDQPVGHAAYGFLKVSPIARGRIVAIDEAPARAVAGVLDIFTYRNASEIKGSKFFSEGGTASTTIVPLSSPKIWHDGQIVALVVAETFEAAREAAHRLRVEYAAEAPSASFDDPGTTVEAAAALKKHKDPKVGDAEAAFAAAPVKIDAHYSTPTQHHNPMELFTTTCAWQDDELTIHEPSQFVYGLKNGVAEQLGIDPGKVRVLSHYIGGAFGSKGSVTPRTAIVAFAARRLKRPVKLVLMRQQGYTVATYRAETRHRVRLGAGSDGKLVAYLHEGREVTSRPDSYVVGGSKDTAHMYAYGNVATHVDIVHADRNTPGFMRSPPEVPYVYALETAMDEMAVALRMDPIEFRRRNDTQTSPIDKTKPYSSRSLMQCFDEGSRAFGWSRRTPEPGSMREGDWLVGWGCAMAMYPTQVAPASCRVRFTAEGKARAQLAAHDIGTGTYTVAGQAVALRLGIERSMVEVELGDTRLPAAPVSGGSNATASTSSVLIKACDQIRARLFQAAVREGPLAGQRPEQLELQGGVVVAPNGQKLSLADAFKATGLGVIEEYAEWYPPGKSAEDVAKLYHGSSAITGGAEGPKLMFAFGAEFVEVRINARTREIRFPRLVGAFAAGRIANPRTARSQLLGGLIWGVSSALHEETEIDRRYARYVNNDIAEYLVPVNADVGEVEVILVPEVDHDVNPAGIKGLGELGNVGTAAAVSNAVFHATGKRIRELPIRLDDLL